MGSRWITAHLGGTPESVGRPDAIYGFPHGGGSPRGNREVESSIEKVIREASVAMLEERQRVIEEWCERSLTDPEQRGVCIVNDGPTTFWIGLDESVPYGTIHEYLEPPWRDQ